MFGKVKEEWGSKDIRKRLDSCEAEFTSMIDFAICLSICFFYFYFHHYYIYFFLSKRKWEGLSYACEIPNETHASFDKLLVKYTCVMFFAFFIYKIIETFLPFSYVCESLIACIWNHFFFWKWIKCLCGIVEEISACVFTKRKYNCLMKNNIC